VGFLEELPAGSLQPVRYFGRELVLARAEGGGVALVDAFCPHLGAHLGAGGRMEGDELVCPFHGWRFGLDGACRVVPYARRRPHGIALGVWRTRVSGGIVWAWHGEPGAEPSWSPPVVPELEDPRWSALAHRAWTVRTRNQEIVENSADATHFPSVHGFADLPRPELSFEGSLFRSTTRFRVPRRGGDLVESTLDVQWYGLGIGVTRTTGTLDFLFLGTNTPIDDERLDVRFSFAVRRDQGASTSEGVGRAAIEESVRQLEQDIPIWEHKCYRARPLLSDADGPIGRFREWARQFDPVAPGAGRG